MTLISVTGISRALKPLKITLCSPVSRMQTPAEHVCWPEALRDSRRPGTAPFFLRGPMGGREAADISRKQGLTEKPPAPRAHPGAPRPAELSGCEGGGGGRGAGGSRQLRDLGGGSPGRGGGVRGLPGTPPPLARGHPALRRPAPQAHL